MNMVASLPRVAPPLKWHGGKWYLAPKIVALMPPHVQPAMCRTLATLLSAVLALSAAPAAPRPKEAEDPKPYMPTALAAKWVYDDGGKVYSEEIVEAEDRGDRTLLTVRVVGPATPGLKRRLVVSADGVFDRGVGAFTYDPVCVMKFPPKAGDEWELHVPVQVGLRGYQGKATVGAAEKVVVPAGTFEAVPVRLEVTAANGRPLDEPEVYTSWWARGVGVVKLRYPDGTRALKSFTRPKD
jgi:hypothetical protein